MGKTLEEQPPTHQINFYNKLGFVNKKRNPERVLVIKPITEKQSCIWEDKDDLLLIKNKKEFIFPETDRFCKVKMEVVDNYFKVGISDLVSTLQNSANIYSGKAALKMILNFNYTKRIFAIILKESKMKALGIKL